MKMQFLQYTTVAIKDIFLIEKNLFQTTIFILDEKDLLQFPSNLILLMCKLLSFNFLFPRNPSLSPTEKLI